MDTLTNPDYVYQSGEYPERKLHYKKDVLPFPYTQDFLTVVVSYAEPGPAVAQIVTAYRKPPDEVRETLIWSRRGATP